MLGLTLPSWNATWLYKLSSVSSDIRRKVHRSTHGVVWAVNVLAVPAPANKMTQIEHPTPSFTFNEAGETYEGKKMLARIPPAQYLFGNATVSYGPAPGG